MTAGDAVRALPRAVLFDMDGTLIDSEPLWLEAEHDVMAVLGGQWTDADREACLGNPIEHVVDIMIERAGSSRTRAEVVELLLDAMERRLLAHPIRWRPGAQELLAACLAQGLPTALVSASWGRMIQAVSARIDEAVGGAAFGAVVAGDDVERTKPHPDPYVIAARMLGFEPQECLAIEDSVPGVASAVAAGCRVVAVPDLVTIEQPGVATVPSLAGVSIEGLWLAATRA